MKVVIIFCVFSMCFTNFSNASFHYLRRDDLERKLDHQRTLQRADADDNRKKELLLEWMLDDLLQAEIEPEIEKESSLETELALTSLRDLEALEQALAEEDGKWLDVTTELEDDLPDNYHNTTEMRTNVNGNDLDIKETIDKTTSDDRKATILKEIFELTPTDDGEDDKDDDLELFSCSLTQPCPKDQYCLETEFTSVCLICQALESGCVDDAQCCSAPDGSLTQCVSGVCTSGVELGAEGTICDLLADCHPVVTSSLTCDVKAVTSLTFKTSDDCQQDMCCVEVLDFPRQLCRRYSRLQERCSPVTEEELATGLSYNHNYFCPCKSGLACEPHSSSSNKMNSLGLLQNHVCTLPKPDNRDANQLQELGQDNSETRVSDEKIADLITRLWQARAETEDDQWFDQSSQMLHHGMKESKFDTENKPSM